MRTTKPNPLALTFRRWSSLLHKQPVCPTCFRRLTETNTKWINVGKTKLSLEVMCVECWLAADMADRLLVYLRAARNYLSALGPWNDADPDCMVVVTCFMQEAMNEVINQSTTPLPLQVSFWRGRFAAMEAASRQMQEAVRPLIVLSKHMKNPAVMEGKIPVEMLDRIARADAFMETCLNQN